MPLCDRKCRGSQAWDGCRDLQEMPGNRDTLPQGKGVMFFQPLIKLNP